MKTIQRAYGFGLASLLAVGGLCGCVHTEEPAEASAGTTPLNATSLNTLDVPSTSGTVTAYPINDGPVTTAPAKPQSNANPGTAGSRQR
jgi:hypothetical protein